jgi:malonyl-CoA decarboxylase
MPPNRTLYDLLDVIAVRGRAFVERARKGAAPSDTGDTVVLLERLISGRGEASGLAIAQEILNYWRASDTEARLEFLRLLAERFGPDETRLAKAVEDYQRQPDARNAAAIHQAAEPRRQELIRRLNMVSGAMEILLEMRATTLAQVRDTPSLALVDADFMHLLSSWFNRGFLLLQPIDWSTSASILERIIQHEAVHAIGSWNDLRLRLAPSDRRCFAFFHPRLPDDPLIFVEVALTRDTPARIGDLLAVDRPVLKAEDATTAVFYSISNTQIGLRGVSFGNFLLKQVIETLQAELPNIREYVTLSPLPGFATWLSDTAASEPGKGQAAMLIERLSPASWTTEPAREAFETPLVAEVARYLIEAKNAAGQPLDSVARFHLGNGARLERINFLADTSPKAMRESYGVMVNYLYKLDDIEKNHELYASEGAVVAARPIQKLLPIREPGRGATAIQRTVTKKTDAGSPR